MSLAPKKDGGPNTKFFESPETISLFDAIKSWLQKNCKKVSWRGQLLSPGVGVWLVDMIEGQVKLPELVNVVYIFEMVSIQLMVFDQWDQVTFIEMQLWNIRKIDKPRLRVWD